MAKSIHIAIDCNEANIKNRVGSNVYAYNILMALQGLAKTNKITCTLFHAEKLVDDMPKQAANWRYQHIGPRKFWTQWALPRQLFSEKDTFDAFFTPGHYAPRFCPIPSVVSVMDTAYLVYPEQFRRRDYLQLKMWTQYSVQQAAKVIAISDFTKSEVCKYYKKEEKDVVVASPAAPEKIALPNQQKQLSMLKALRVSKPYFLFVGTVQPRKNIEQLITAFEIFVTDVLQSSSVTPQFSEYQLVIAGKIGWMADPIVQRAKESPVTDQILLTNYVMDDEKAVLYSNATATILPGLYEGFGIPPLEAMQYGSIPIVSNSSSLPEVVGDAGFKIDPTSSEELAAALQSVAKLTDSERKKMLVEGQKQAQKFSWKESAKTILSTIQNVASDKNNVK